MNSVFGLEKVLLHLSNHKDAYIIIGGIATKLLLERKGFPSRETKDFDIVLLANATKEEFSKDILALIKEGKYTKGSSNGRRIAYRFVEPKQNGYPKIIELFAVDNNKQLNRYLEKINIIDDEEELSAIVVDEDIFNFIIQRKTFVDELPVVDEIGLIALKSHAYFQNYYLYNEKKIINKNDYLKHRNDVIRLLLSLNSDEKAVSLPKILKDDCYKFVEILRESQNVVKQIAKTNVEVNTLIEHYKKLFF